jgi:pyridoxine kinase
MRAALGAMRAEGVQTLTRRRRVLSIQSHVVSGYVGNKAAVFPLQVQGFEVDCINSVQFSNHTGYPHFKGQVLNGEDLLTLLEGLEKNNLLSQYTHLLTGYIGSEAFLRAVEQVLKKLREASPDLVYVCDPVMGDTDTGMYVPEGLPALYRDWVSNATVCTPNGYEAEALTGIQIRTADDAARACDVLHGKGIQTVLMTTLDVEGEPNHISMMISQQRAGPPPTRYILAVPKIEQNFTGTGDLSAAMCLAWMDKHPYVPIACGVLFLGFYLFNLVMISTALCCRSPRLMNAYHRMFLTAPANLIFLTVVSVVFGVMVGFGLLAYTMQSVVAVFGLTCGLIVALTAFAVYTKADFTGLGAYFLVALVGLLLTGILVGLTSYPGSVAHKIYAGLGATVFGFLVVYDTQLIFGTASSAERKLQYTVDAYAFAAFQLYLDYINLFLYLLQLLGQRR